MAGTGKKGSRFPVPSAPHPRDGPPAPHGTSLRGRTARAGSRNPQKQRPGYAGSSAASAPPRRRQNGSGGCGSQASGVCSASARSRRRGRRPRPRGHGHAPSAAGSQGRPAHRGPQLTPAVRSWASAWRCRRAGDPNPRGVAGAAEAVEQPRGKQRVASFFQGAG